MVPHVAACKTHQRLLKFSFVTPKRLLQQYLPQAEVMAYSMTSSARAISVGDNSRPRAFAVLRLRTKSNLVGCSTGMSAGFAPRKILLTCSAARRNRSVQLGP